MNRLQKSNQHTIRVVVNLGAQKNSTLWRLSINNVAVGISPLNIEKLITKPQEVVEIAQLLKEKICASIPNHKALEMIFLNTKNRKTQSLPSQLINYQWALFFGSMQFFFTHSLLKTNYWERKC